MIRFDRRRDRMRGEYVMISFAELDERGIDASECLVGRSILYNGAQRVICAAGKEHILLDAPRSGKQVVLTDKGFREFLSDGDPTFDCPCGMHTMTPRHYNYCTQGSGLYVYEFRNRALIDFIKGIGKKHLLK